MRMGRCRRVAAAASAGALSGVLLAAPASIGASPEPVTLRAAVSRFSRVDPQLASSFAAWTTSYDTYIPLLTYRHAAGTAGSEVIPGLAMRMPMISDGGRTYTLFLRRGLRYSDGTPVRASDFKFAIERMFKLNSGGSYDYTDIVGARAFRKTGRGRIKGIVCNDSSGRIAIHLVKPKPGLLDVLAFPYAAPVPRDTPMRNQTLSPPPATGPYMIARSKRGVGWMLVRNPAWESGNARLMPQLPSGHVDRIEFRVVPYRNARVAEVASGRLDWTADAPARRYAHLEHRFGRTRFRIEPGLSTLYFWLDTARPPFDDVRVRRAANYAVSRSALKRIYRGQLIPSEQILPPGMPGYRKLDLYPYNLAKARRLVAEADPPDREVTIWTDGERLQRRAAAYFRRELEKIGLRAHLEVVRGFFNYIRRTASRSTPNLDTGWSNWYADYPHPDDFFRPLLLGSSITRRYNENLARIDVPALNSRIERLSRKPLGRGLERRYAALDRSYMRLAPWVPYGSFAESTFVSRAIDLDRVVWNPTFGADLTSFRFREGPE
ncbi:MAG TPA: ABC transporter substrate-binding protein [Solirubrobacterales bacterium]